MKQLQGLALQELDDNSAMDFLQRGSIKHILENKLMEVEKELASEDFATIDTNSTTESEAAIEAHKVIEESSLS